MAAMNCMVFFLLPCAALGATLEGRTMRRESVPRHSAYLGPGGEVLTKMESDSDDNFCDYDFVLGEEGSNECSAGHPDHPHSRILQEAMCMFAATQSGATAPAGPLFRVETTSFEHRPQGCFKIACENDASKTCYQYNGAPATPHGPIFGAPVCWRKKLVYGEKDTNGGCPDGYQVVDSMETCREEATCMTKVEGKFFNVGVDERNASKHLDFPRGCFESATGEVFYNGASKMGEGTAVKGTPICSATWPTVHLTFGSGNSSSTTSNDSTTNTSLLELEEGVSAYSDLKNDLCNFDFPLGTPDTNDCGHEDDSQNHSLILQESMCLLAATEHKATTLPGPQFRIPVADQGKHPKGCFKNDCGDARPGETCYFFNSKENILNGTVTGSPVCSRTKYLLSGNHSVDETGGCPSSYKVLDDEKLCGPTAACLGRSRGAEFRVGVHTATEHLEYPRGCFVSDGTGEVRFNTASKMGPPTVAKGVSVCVAQELNTE